MKYSAVFLIIFSLALLTYGQEGRKTKEFPRFMKENTKSFRSDAQAAFIRIFGMEEGNELRPLKTAKDQLGFTHDRYQQYYKNAKVDGAVWSVHSKNDLIESYSGEFKGIKNFDTSPAISPETGKQRALNHVGAKVYAWENSVKAGYPDYTAPKGELVIIGGAPDDNLDLTLAWKYDIYAADPLYRAEVFINAKTGEYIKENQLIHNVNTSSSGTMLYNGLQYFTSDYTGSLYRLRQTVSGGGVQTYTLKNSIFYFLASDVTSTNPNSWSDATAIQAHWGAERTWEYYNVKHGRNSFNNAGAILKSYVHYSTNYVNAFWDGSRMTYGDGDLSQGYRPLVSIDICGHEITHGVTTYEANLTYSNESGALNESFSDIFGESIENYATGSNDWMMSCDIGANGCGAFRNMMNPNQYGDPDTYKGTFWYSGTDDNGGVHINSGVMNKWFYILVKGETGTNDLGRSYSVTGIGLDKAAVIAYRNLTVYLSASSVYADARVGALQSASDFYGAGSAEYQATAEAWNAVGVYAFVDTQPPTPPVLSCPSKTITSVDLSWTASTDNVGVTGYDLYQDGGRIASNLTERTYKVEPLLENKLYSFFVVAKDAAGNTATSTTLNVTTNVDVTETVVGDYHYESNLFPWVSSNTKYCQWNSATAYCWDVPGSVKICYKNITCTSPQFSLSGYSQVEVKFYFTAVGMEAGKTFTLRYSSNNGSSWSTVATFTATTSSPTTGTNFNNNQFYLATVILNSATFNSTAKFRIHISGTSTTDIIYFDAVTIKGRTNTSGTGNNATLEPKTKSSPLKNMTLADPSVEGTVLYPNPAMDVLNIKSEEPIRSVKIFSMNGTLLMTRKDCPNHLRLEISGLKHGLYLVEVTTGDVTTRHKILKE